MFTLALLPQAVGDWPRPAPLLPRCGTLVWHLAWSAAYHVGSWPLRRRALLRAADHRNIYLVIAATCTAVGGSVLNG
jgi:hypothetical protein